MNLRYPLCVLALLFLSVAAQAEDKQMNEELEYVSGPPEQCIRLQRIDRTEVLDDYSILFHMKGGDIYLNRLPHRCPGLAFRDSFMYRTSLNQLCNVDIITVLDNMGFGFSPGASCGLGLFYPVSKEDVKQLKERQKSRD
ncbi:DUF6491 family protein [Elongatibacter sediminis]|uniref:DUF6491 family protein n=1 Tax=Elongatibacter sediminis TaxID=3119006 RepID=A0AAW9R4L6_9GAMM